MYDYEFLKLIWWLLIGVLLIGFAVTDGFDMGALSLLRIATRDDRERRVILNAVGPHWDGNQVWFITAGGAIFAAWPVVYGVAFSGLYWALLLVLFALFFRPVGFEYRSKIETRRWRENWDILLSVASAIPALVFGVAFGNLFLGLPFDLDPYMLSHYNGSFWALLNPFGLLCGLVSLLMLVMHGGAFLQLRTDGDLRERLSHITRVVALACLVLFVIAGIWVALMPGYHIATMPAAGSVMTPLQKTVELVPGGWLSNYQAYPWTVIFPLLGIASLGLTALAAKRCWSWATFLLSSIAVAAIILTAGFSLFPFIFPSSLQPDHSLTLWDVTSSRKTLDIMLVVALVFVPIIICYTTWGYYKMWRRLNVEFIEENRHAVY